MVLLLSLVACTPKEPKDTGPVLDVAPIFDANAKPWSKGTDAFKEVTTDWGLTDIAPDGTRIEAVDFDHDGWPDLEIRKAGGADDFNPGGVRQVWLLKNMGNKTFKDVTQESGIMKTRYGTDANIGRGGPTFAWGDVDNDGDLDVYTGYPNAAGITDTAPETSEVMLNNGDGTFSFASETNDIRLTVNDMPYGASMVDYDLDGILDLYTPEYTDKNGYPQQSHLYKGNGDGTFKSTTNKAGLKTADWIDVATINIGGAHTESWASLACDLNNDGWPELMASSYGRAPNNLWVNQGDGSYKNHSAASGYAYDQRIDWTDNESARCWCTLHPTDDGCKDHTFEPPDITCNVDADAFRWNNATDRELYRLGGNSGSTMCGDVDNDGWMDLLTTEIVHWDVGTSSDPSELLHNMQSPDVSFERPGNDVTGLTRDHVSGWNDGDMTGTLFDFDNDGWNDVYIGSSDYPGARGLLWHQTSPMVFEAVPIKNGIDHMRSHGSAVADFDRDGDLDIVVGHSPSRCDSDCYPTFVVRMFENQLNGNFVEIEAQGTGTATNHTAIGARVEVTAGGVTQTHQVDGGHGQLGMQDDLVQHFGLGTNASADVKITWPTAGFPTQTFTVPAGHRYLFTQGTTLPVVEDP